MRNYTPEVTLPQEYRWHTAERRASLQWPIKARILALPIVGTYFFLREVG